MLNLFGKDPRIIFANSVSNVMMEPLSHEYLEKLTVANDRKIWTLREGDILVTQYPVSSDLKNYILSQLNLSESLISFLSPASFENFSLSDNVMQDKNILQKLKDISANKKINFHPFIWDISTLKLINELDCSVSFYPNTSFEDDIFNKIIYLSTMLNTKNGFKEQAFNLDIPISPGFKLTNKQEAINNVIKLLSDFPKVIVKKNRASNGMGHKVFQSDLKNIENEVENYFNSIQNIDHIVEAFYEPDWIPSFEFVVTSDDVHFTYDCEMKCPNLSWSGMVIPAINMPSEIRIAMRNSGERFAKWLHTEGFRGIFDLDGIALQNGNWFFTEVNLRSTGGTHMNILLERLCGSDYLTNKVIIADSHYIGNKKFMDVLEKCSLNNLLYNGKNGVIFTTDGSRYDHKCRYLIISDNLKTSEQIEEKLKSI